MGEFHKLIYVTFVFRQLMKFGEPSIFLSLGELGPGDNIGLLAAKTSSTAVRGQYYAVAAAIGKIGAFVGTYVFPLLQDNPNPIAAGQNPFFVASALCIFASIITFFGIPHIGQVGFLLPTIPRHLTCAPHSAD